jgi:hypothetical protein
MTTYTPSAYNTLFTAWLADNATEMNTEEYTEARADFNDWLFTEWLEGAELTPDELLEARTDFNALLPTQ